MFSPNLGLLHCLVCQDEQKDISLTIFNLEQTLGTSSTTVKNSVESVLNIKVNLAINPYSILCIRCYSDLVEIEPYYKRVDEFRKRYHDGLKKSGHGEKSSGDGLSSISSFLEGNQQTWSNFHANSPLLSSCRFQENSLLFAPELSPKDLKGGQIKQENTSEVTSENVENDRIDSSKYKDEGSESEDTMDYDPDSSSDFEPGKDGNSYRKSTSPDKKPAKSVQSPPRRRKNTAPKRAVAESEDDIAATPSSKQTKNSPVEHKRGTPRNCSICDRKFYYEKSFKRHVMNHLVNKEDKDSEKTSKVDDNQIKDNNNEESPDIQGLESQVKTHIGEVDEQPVVVKKKRNRAEGQKCNICDEILPTRREYKLHKLDVHGKQGYMICMECGADFGNDTDLQTHIANDHYNTSDQMVQCEECKAEFHTTAQLARHREKPCKKRNATCNICRKTFRGASNLSTHMATHTGERPFECTYCGVRFATAGNLKNHVSIHTQEKPFKCSVCGMAFRLSSSRNYHEKTHSEVPEFPCQLCGTAFYNLKNHKQHMQSVHPVVKSFLCNQCGMGFSTQHRLTRHQVSHSNARPYSCSWCQKGFKTRKHLKVHERIHTGEKPYVCYVCGYKCAQDSSLKSHMKTHQNKEEKLSRQKQTEKITHQNKGKNSEKLSPQQDSPSLYSNTYPLLPSSENPMYFGYS